jgi:hypothetical protein
MLREFCEGAGGCPPVVSPAPALRLRSSGIGKVAL